MHWTKILLAESSIWQIYRKSPGFWTNRFNTAVILLTAIFLGFFALLHLYPPPWASSITTYSLNNAVIGWANLGFTYTATMLAFLLAGFTVFSTLTKPSLLAELAQIPHKDKKDPERASCLRELQFVFFGFINVFVHYMCFLVLSAVIVLFDTKGGPLTIAGDLLRQAITPGICDLLQHVFFVVMGVWFVLLFLQLKSFVWNLYQMVLVVIASEESTKHGVSEPTSTAGLQMPRDAHADQYR